MTVHFLNSNKQVLGSYSRGGSSATFSASSISAVGNYVAWRVAETASAGGAAKDSIWAQRFDYLTHLWRSPFKVTERNWSQIAPTIRTADLPRDRFVVVWEGQAPAGGADDGGLKGLIARTYDKDGNPEGPEFLLTNNAIPDGPLFDVLGAPEEDGGFIVLWANGNTIKSVKVARDNTVKTPWTFATLPSPPLCISASRTVRLLTVAWSYDSGSGVRCFVQQLENESAAAGTAGESVNPYTPTPLEIGTATAGNSEIWITRTDSVSFGQPLVVRGEGAGYRTYRITLAEYSGAPFVIDTTGSALLSGVTSMPNPPGFSVLLGQGYPVYFSLLVGQTSTTDKDGNPYPGGATRGHLLHLKWTDGTIRSRMDLPLTGTVSTGAPVAAAYATSHYSTIGYPTVAVLTYTGTAMEVVAYADDPITEVDPGGPLVAGPVRTIGDPLINELSVIPLPGHPTAQGLLYWLDLGVSHFALLDANGDIIGTPTTYNTPHPGTYIPNRMVITPDNSGGFVLVQVGYLPNWNRYFYSVVSRFDATLTLIGSTTLLNDLPNEEFVGFPFSEDYDLISVDATFAGSNLVVAYCLKTMNPPGGNFATYSTRVEIFNAATLAPISGSPFTFDSCTGRDNMNSIPRDNSYYQIGKVDVAGLTSGNFVLAWSVNYNSPDTDIRQYTRYGIYTSSGSVVRAPGNMTTGTMIGVYRMSGLTDGGFMANISAPGVSRVLYFNSSGDQTNGFVWPLNPGLNGVLRTPCPDGTWLVADWDFTSVGSLVYAISREGAVRGGGPTHTFLDPSNGLSSNNFAVVGRLNNGRVLTSVTKYYQDGVVYISNRLFTQVLEPTGRTSSGVNDLVSYDASPEIVPGDNAINNHWPIGFSPRGTGGSVAYYYYDTINSAIQPLNACCELVGTPVVLNSNLNLLDEGSVMGLSNGNIVAAAGWDWGSAPSGEDGNGYFWLWSVDENAETISPVQTKVMFQAGSSDHKVRFARCAPLPGGGFVIVWVNDNRSWDNNFVNSTVPMICARFYDASGSALGPAVIVDDRNGEADGFRFVGSGNPYYGNGFLVKPLSNGNVVIAWDVVDWWDDNRAAVWARVYAPNGTAVSGILQVGNGFPTGPTGPYCEMLKMVVATPTGFDVVWQDLGVQWSGYDNDSYFVLRRSYTNAGVATTSPSIFDLEHISYPVYNGSKFAGPPYYSTGQYANTRFSVLPDGAYVVIADENDPTGRQLSLRRFNATTTLPIGERVVFDPYTRVGSEDTSFVEVLSNGNIGVFWMRPSDPVVQYFAVDGNPIPTCGAIVPLGPAIRVFWIN